MSKRNFCFEMEGVQNIFFTMRFDGALEEMVNYNLKQSIYVKAQIVLVTL
jgi:hypothetical protein